MAKRSLHWLLNQVLPALRWRGAGRRADQLAPRKRNARRLAVEPLEDRTLLSTLTSLPVPTMLPPSDSTGGVSQALISANGQFVAFTSTASNLVSGQVNTAVDGNVFLYDRQDGSTTLVSHLPGSTTTGGDGNSQFPRVSSDGRYVVYESTATNLITGQTGPRGQANVFLYDRSTQNNTLISHRFDSSTTTANDFSTIFYTTGFGFSPNSGRFLLFSSSATDLLSNQTGPAILNLFLYDTMTTTTTLVSHNFSPFLTGANGATLDADLSPDGTSIVFESFATDVVSGQTGGTNNIFLYNHTTDSRRLLSGVFNGLGNSPTDGAGSSFRPFISANGRTISYTSGAADLVERQTSNASLNIFSYDTLLGMTFLVSGANGSSSVTANANSTESAVSSDGSTIAFLSDATNLTTNQGPNTGNVFLYNTSAGALTLVSHLDSSPDIAAGGVATNDTGTFADLSLSADGRLVSYESAANLVANQSNPSPPVRNIFLYDGNNSGHNTLVSRVNGTSTVTGNQNSFYTRLSADGSAIAFPSLATNLDPSESVADGGQNLFVFSVTAGTGPTLASQSAFQANATSLIRGTSADGRFVLFTSNLPNVVPNQDDHNFDQDVFLFDRDTGAITLVSHRPQLPTTTGAVGSPDTLAGVAPSVAPVISADGNWIVFVSDALNLVTGQTGANFDQVFLFNRQTGLVALVSHRFDSLVANGNDAAYNPVISADGSYVAYTSNAEDLVSNFTEPTTGSHLANVYLYRTSDGSNTLVSHAAASSLLGGDGGSLGPVISDDGHFVVYQSLSTTLVQGAVQTPARNIYLYDRSTNINTLVSHTATSLTTSSTGSSTTPAISPDGSFVAFVSFGTNLVNNQQPPASTTPYTNVFVYDNRAQVSGSPNAAYRLIRLASGANGSPTTTAGGFSDSPALSSHGNDVTFRSDAPDLVTEPANTPVSSNIFLFDQQAGSVTLLSHQADAMTTPAAGNSEAPTIVGADDGTDGLVVYLSTATNLVPGQQGGGTGINNVFLYSLPNRANVLVSAEEGTPLVASRHPTSQATVSRQGAVFFNVLSQETGGTSRSGGGSIGFINKLLDVVLSPNTVADGRGPGSLVGLLSIVSQYVGNYLVPAYRLSSASNLSFALNASGGGAALLTRFVASYASQQSYQITVHVDIGFGDNVATLLVLVVPNTGFPPPSVRPISAKLVPVKVGKKKKTIRLLVKIFFADTGVEKKEFLSPFQQLAFTNIQVRVRDTDGDGIPDQVVLTAKKGKKKVSRTVSV